MADLRDYRLRLELTVDYFQGQPAEMNFEFSERIDGTHIFGDKFEGTKADSPGLALYAADVMLERAMRKIRERIKIKVSSRD